MKRLIVFVHGLGAEKNERDEFWGSTPELLRGHPNIDSTFDLKFWTYPSNKRLNWLGPIGRLFGKDRELASLEGLGRLLWTRLRSWARQGSYSDIKLLGHSLGGLVVASAIGYGLQNCPEDENLIQILSGAALVATPLRGSALADKAGLAWRNNKQVMGLMTNSESRQFVVNRFIQAALQEHKLPLTIFEAPEDGTLQEGDLTAPLPDDIEYSLESLSGGHSGCINSLEVNHPNLEILVNWLISSPEAELELNSHPKEEPYLKVDERKDNISDKNIMIDESSQNDLENPQALNVLPQVISRRKFRTVLSNFLGTEKKLKQLCEDLPSSSVRLTISYGIDIRSDEYRENSDSNLHLDHSIGNLYDYLRHEEKLNAFIDWLSQAGYAAIKKDLGLEERI